MSLIYQQEDLRAAFLAGRSCVDFSPYGDQKALLVDLASEVDERLANELAEWLPTLVCPVIGIRDPGLHCASAFHPAVSKACDVLLDEPEQAFALLEKIEQNPVAASSFIDLLRVTESMPLMLALSVESAVYATLQAGAEYAAWLEQYEVPAAPDADEGEALLIEQDGANVIVTLNRPNNRNAMSVEMRDALVAFFKTAAFDDSIQAIHLFGRGKCFSTGGDLREFGSVPDSAAGHVIRLLSVPGKFMAPLAQKVSVHLHGACVGSGIEFPAFAGRITADKKAWFSLPEVGMGLIPGAGGCISIARRIGRQRLGYWGLSGRRITADVALAWGLVDELV